MASILCRGVIHGKIIELEREPGLPEGQQVNVQVEPAEAPPRWLERFTVDPAVAPGKILVRGTRLRAEDLVPLVQEGRTNEELQRLHPELAVEDVDAIREYAKVPAGLRRSFGAWADDAEELDRFLAERRRLRKLSGRGSEG